MADTTRIFTVDKFTGLNEAPDGDTELQFGEASYMSNWYVTDGLNLKLRPGINSVSSFTPGSEILHMSAHKIGDTEYLVVVDLQSGQDRITMLTESQAGEKQVSYTASGLLGITEKKVIKAFSLGGAFFLMSQANTVQWTGAEFVPAEFYIPMVVTGASPAGGGAQLESINLLSPKRRVEFSADGDATAYVLPEEAEGVEWAKVDNEIVAGGSFSADTHTYTFQSAPVKGVSNVEIQYFVTDGVEAAKQEITSCRLCEAYNGSTDTRLFVAGNGTNRCYYTGVPMSGDLTKLYFPAMNEVAVDMSASPVTGIVRHYSRLMVFKPDGAYTISYSPVTLSDGSTIAGFYLRPANREFGNDIVGQIQTVDNFPRTLTKGGIYEWKITASYYQDERYAVRVSDKARKTLAAADVSKIVTCDDNYTKTYYAFLNDSSGTVLVNRYGLTKDGVWCVYHSQRCRDVRFACIHAGKMAFSAGANVAYFDWNTTTDFSPSGADRLPITASWESGYLSFGQPYRRKYSSDIYVSTLPDAITDLTVTAATDRRDSYLEKQISSKLFSFENLDFSDFSFDTSDAPNQKRIRIKVKKFIYYKLIFRVDTYGSGCTVLGYTQKVRFSSMAK